ncbi:MAG: hypothetical protein V4594_04510 [Bacteroidota bacterium]
MNAVKDSKENEKTGVIPNVQISGSDADKAYDQDGNFSKAALLKEGDPKRSDSQAGSDADSPGQ